MIQPAPMSNTAQFKSLAPLDGPAVESLVGPVGSPRRKS